MSSSLATLERGHTNEFVANGIMRTSPGPLHQGIASAGQPVRVCAESNDHTIV